MPAKCLIRQGADSTRGTQIAQRGQVNFQTTPSNNIHLEQKLKKRTKKFRKKEENYIRIRKKIESVKKVVSRINKRNRMTSSVFNR